MQEPRTPLTTDRIVEECRELLVEGGTEAVVVREVARRLGVTAPALYKHVSGRDDLLTLLISSCHDELAMACEKARDASDPSDSPSQLHAATAAFRHWALQHPGEFALLYGQPILGYSAPQGGPTKRSARRFGDVFAGIYARLLHDGRLRMPESKDLPPGFAQAVAAGSLARDQDFSPEAVHQFALGFQRMLGLVSVEVAGHLDWAMNDTAGFVERQLDALVDEIVLPATG